VTGGSAGIGIETARALASAGAEVTITARDLDDGRRVAADIKQLTGKHVGLAHLDLANPVSVDAFVATWDRPLDILVNNAGVMRIPVRTLTPEGHELHFATNHLGHFRLALGLRPALASAGKSRIVSLTSVGHLRSKVVFDDIDFDARPYDPGAAYSQSKTANILFAVEATRRWAADGIAANAVHPGSVNGTKLSRYMDPVELEALMAWAAGLHRRKSLEQGAATSVLVAASPSLDGIGGRYFEDCNEAMLIANHDPENGGSSGVASYALDPDNANNLWQLSLARVQSS
jgi:NAD(P)-dependent dehydrogenase (short-subunit alcohol dehydrogenase family)